MKKEEIQVGHVYAKRVGPRVVPIRITADRGSRSVKAGFTKWREKHLGWEAVNLKTGRKVHVRSAQSLRFEMDAGGKGPLMPVRGHKQAAKAIADAKPDEPVLVDLTPDDTFPGYSKERVDKGLDRLAADLDEGGTPIHGADDGEAFDEPEHPGAIRQDWLDAGHIESREEMEANDMPGEEAD